MLSLSKLKNKGLNIKYLILILLLMLFSFQLGRLWPVKDQTKNTQLQPASLNDAFYKPSSTSLTKQPISEKTIASPTPSPNRDLRVFASKKAKSKLYHFTWCPGAQKIKPENKITFNTEQEAIQTGYKLASNCVR